VEQKKQGKSKKA